MHDDAERPREPAGFPRAIELYLEDMQGLARLTTTRSVAEYRRTGETHAQTTEGYLTKPSPDELVEAMARVTLGVSVEPR